MATKTFVSTRETQGQRENDFCFVPEGEILTFPKFICTNEKADGNCGCNRSLCGTASLQATTTAKVVAIKSYNTLVEAIYQNFITGGWSQYMSEDDMMKEAEENATRLVFEAEDLPPGTIVEYRSGIFSRREQAQERNEQPSQP